MSDMAGSIKKRRRICVLIHLGKIAAGIALYLARQFVAESRQTA
jgi:hypothetical protein